MKKTFTLLLGSLALTMQANAQLVINEVMQSNIDCIMDDTNEFPDSWVELYNPSSTDEELSNYKLGLSNDVSTAISLPSLTIPANGYVVIYCDKANEGLHMPFRLESGKGGNIYLFKDESIIDKIEKMKKQPAPNIAYGRKDDGSDKWGYMEFPTPGAANCGKVCKDILGEPIFSSPGRVFENKENITLELSLPTDTPEGTVIRYTLDGTEPTQESTAYSSPISISDTKVVRAKLFCDGYLSPRSTTASYIYHNREVTLPVISIVSNDKYFYDNQTGIIVDGKYDSSKKNYEFDWRRPINLEYFESANANSQLNQLCETRVMGGNNRDRDLKSLAIYANKRFGEKRFNYEFFPDQRPGITDFKSLALRNAGNDFNFLYMRDAIIQRSVAQHVDLDWQAWSPAIIYINGVYKGILNIRDRSNEDNIYTYYDGLEDIDMLENNTELKSGDTENFNQFQKFYSEQGHTMAEYEKWMDCKEYINLMVMDLFYNNQDFPGNNIVCWRPRTNEGKWRWIAKDTDLGLGLYGIIPASYTIFEWFYNPDYDKFHAWANKEEHTRLFRHLMEDEDFKREFLEHAAIYLGDFLTEKNVLKLWNGMYDRVKTELPYHRKLYKLWWSNYDSEMKKAQTWLKNRIPSFYQQMSDFYKVGTPTPLQINQQLDESDRNMMSITFNGVTLSEPFFDGKFFKGSEITLEGTTTADGKEVVGWNVITTKDGVAGMQEMKGSTCHLTMPDCTNLEITAIVDFSTGIKDVEANDGNTWTWKFHGNQLSFVNVAPDTPIYIYNLQGNILYETQSEGDLTQIPIHNGTYIAKVGNKAIKIVK